MKLEKNVSYEITCTREEFRKIIDEDDVDVFLELLSRLGIEWENTNIQVTDCDRKSCSITIRDVE